MTEDERQYRAHLALHGQPLLIEWMARAKLYDEGRKLYDEGRKLRAEGDKFRAEGRKLRAEGSKRYAEGDIQWFAAVCAEYGVCAVVDRQDDACIVGGHTYAPVPMFGDPT